MRWCDISKGTVVYHNLMTHWGKGVVIKIDYTDFLERQFEGGRKRVVVQFEGHEEGDTCRMQAVGLRKTPNMKKMRAMVEIYTKRGTEAYIDVDRLVIIKKEDSKSGTTQET